MLVENQIFFSKKYLQDFFKMGNPAKRGEMTLEEFIQFASNDKANRSKILALKGYRIQKDDKVIKGLDGEELCSHSQVFPTFQL